MSRLGPIPILAGSLAILVPSAVQSGPATGVAAAQVGELLSEVAFYCGAGPEGRSGPDLDVRCYPGTSSVDSSSEVVTNPACATSTNICVPHVVAETQAILTVTAREVVVDSNPDCSPVPFDGCDIRVQVQAGLVAQDGTQIIDMAAAGQKFESSTFELSSSCPRGNGANSAPGLRIAGWFPFSAKECVVDSTINFGGAVVPDARNYSGFGSQFESVLIDYAATHLGVDRSSVIPLSIAPAGSSAGRAETSLRSSLSSPEPNTSVATYPVRIRFADKGPPLLFEIGHEASPVSAGLEVAGATVYKADYSSLTVVDATDATNPRYLGTLPAGSVEHPGAGIDSFDVSGNLAALTIGGDVELIDLSDPSTLASIGEFDGFFSEVGLADRMAYAKDSISGLLRAIDFTDPGAPAQGGTAFCDGLGRGIDIAGAMAWCGTSLIDVTDPIHPVFLSQLGGSFDWSERPNVAGTFVFLMLQRRLNGSYTEGLASIDISDPYNPRQVAFLDLGSSIADIDVEGRYAYVALGVHGLAIVNVADPTHPFRVGRLREGYFSAVEADGGLIFTSDVIAGFAPEPDPDLDGLPTALEISHCTSPDDRDSDDDGLGDNAEDVNWNGIVDLGELDPCNPDSDGDGVQDGTERGSRLGASDVDGAGPILGTDPLKFSPDADPATTTDPFDADSDDDGVPDGYEDLNGNGSVDPGESDPLRLPECSDGLDNESPAPPGPEVLLGPMTNPANGHSYYLLNPSSWTDAEFHSRALGGHLVTINDAAENQWVYEQFAGDAGHIRNLWLGLNDAASDGTFVWTSGESTPYTNWVPGEPNDAGGVEDYAFVWGPYADYPSIVSRWNDIANDSLYTIYGVVEVSGSGNGDGSIDFPADPGCTSGSDLSEGADCGDGLDNDRDGQVDAPDDPGCTAVNDPSEQSSTFVCDDGLDNDGDGLIDVVEDLGCAFPYSDTESPACDNRIDDDGDGLVDFEDPWCSRRWPYWETTPCGLGGELVLVLALLRAHRRRPRAV